MKITFLNHLQPFFIRTLHTPKTIQYHVKNLKQSNYDHHKLDQPKLTSYTLNFVHHPSFASSNFEDFGFQIQYEKIRVWSF